MKYVKENDFSEHEAEFAEEHVKLAEKLFDVMGDDVYGPILVKQSDPDCLIFNVNFEHKDRVEREIGSKLYTVTIKKIHKIK